MFSLLSKQALLKTFNRPEERLLFSKVLDQAGLSLQNHEAVFTDFLDPAKSAGFLNILKSIKDLNCYRFGGNEECERVRIGFCPFYTNIKNEDFPIKAIKITTKDKFSAPLSHRDYLGSILGLGIDRAKIGDIFIYDDFTVCYADSDMSEYIAVNLIKAGKVKVSAEVYNIYNIELPKKNIKEKYSTVSSLRIDAVISAAFNISRSEAQGLIAAEKVFLNWSVITNNSHTVNENDIISLRGYGRCNLIKINGETKKKRISVILGIYV